jgi:hypothetical protein
MGANPADLQNSLAQAQDTIAVSQTNLAMAMAESSSTKQDVITSEALSAQVKGTSTKYIKINK